MKGVCLALSLCLLGVCFGGRFIPFPYGGRANMLFIPTAAEFGLRLPLFVMLHGCLQNATDFATGTNMNVYGEQDGLFVVYPEQPLSENIAGCWNWFYLEDQVRGSGEPADIIAIVNLVKEQYLIDSSKVFVGGLSAGAAMADILGATYPDVFSGAAIGAGLEYMSAEDVDSAVEATLVGGPDPTTQGQLAYAASPIHKVLAILVVQGTADTTVAPINGDQVVSSFSTTLDLDLGDGHSHGFITDTPSTTTNVPAIHEKKAYTVRTYEDRLTHEALITYITVDGMNHAWSGGNAAGSYTDPTGPDASRAMIDYFLAFAAIRDLFGIGK